MADLGGSLAYREDPAQPGIHGAELQVEQREPTGVPGLPEACPESPYTDVR